MVRLEDLIVGAIEFEDTGGLLDRKLVQQPGGGKRSSCPVIGPISSGRADTAGALGFTRVRITQLVALPLLAPDIQDEILQAPLAPWSQGSGKEP